MQVYSNLQEEERVLRLQRSYYIGEHVLQSPTEITTLDDYAGSSGCVTFCLGYRVDLTRVYKS